jgi:hypothetical protein
MPIGITKEELDLIEALLGFAHKKMWYYPSEEKIAECILDKIAEFKVEEAMKNDKGMG